MTEHPDDDRIVIPFSRPKLWRLLLLATIFAALGVFFVLTPEEFARGTSKDVLIRPVGLAAIVLGLGGGAYFLLRALSSQPALVIDDEGIHDRASAIGVGMLRWSEIEDIVVCEYRGQVMVGIEPKNPECVLRNVNPIKAMFMRGNRLLGFPLVTISEAALDDTAVSIQRLLKKRWDRHRDPKAGKTWPLRPLARGA